MISKFFKLFNKHEAEEITKAGQEVIAKVTKDLEKVESPKVTVKKRKSAPKKKCLIARTMNATGLTDEYEGIVVYTEIIKKWKNTPNLHHMLVTKLNGVKVRKPYIKLVNDIHCTPTRFDTSKYNEVYKQYRDAIQMKKKLEINTYY